MSQLQCSNRYFVLLAVLLGMVAVSVLGACSTVRRPAQPRESEINEEEWRSIADSIKVSIINYSFYADSIREPKSLEMVYMDTDGPLFFIVFAAKTSSLWYLYRYTGVLGSTYCYITSVGKVMDTLLADDWRYLERDISNGDLSPLFSGNMTSQEQLDWARVSDCYRLGKNLYGLDCDGIGRLLRYREEAELIITAASLNEKELGGLLVIEIPNHLTSRINRTINNSIHVKRIEYIDRTVDFPWFCSLILVHVGYEKYRTAIIGYVGKNGVSYRIGPAFSELSDSLVSAPGSDLSEIHFDNQMSYKIFSLDAKSMSRLYESYGIGPDDDTLYTGEANE